MAVMPLNLLNPCPSLAWRSVQAVDATNSGTYLADGEAFCDGYDTTTIPWGSAIVGSFNAAGESVPDTVGSGILPGTPLSLNAGNSSNTSVTRTDALWDGTYCILGIWYFASIGNTAQMMGCTGTTTPGCSAPCSGGVIPLPIPPDDLLGGGYPATYYLYTSASYCAAIQAYCTANPTQCGSGFNITTPCDIGDPFFGEDP